MTQHEELNTLAGAIIDSNLYIVLGTADEAGQPWVSPVYFASAGYTEFYWISSPEARHSRNLVMRPQISIVVFDSQAPVGTGQAVYMLAVARELTGADLERGLVIYNGRFPDPAERGVRTIKPEDVCAPALYQPDILAYIYFLWDSDQSWSVSKTNNSFILTARLVLDSSPRHTKF